MRLLLGSGGFRTAERVAFLAGEMRDHFGDIDKVLFVPYALADYDGYVAMMTQRGLNAGYTLDSIHRCDNPQTAVREAEAIYVGGGNTFRLVDALYRHGLIELIRERAGEGLAYMGVSAGANIACPTMKTTNDMPIVLPPSFDTLGLVPFQINAHYFAGQTHVKTEEGFQEHHGETRNDRLREYHEMNDLTVVGLWEGGVLRVENASVLLRGSPARIFHKNGETRDVDPAADLTDLLRG